MIRVRAFTAILMISVLFPATVEVVENVLHYVNHGHWSLFEETVHHHHAPDTECGCTGGAHVCGLNLTQLFHSSVREPDLRTNRAGLLAAIVPEGAAPCDGFLAPLFRPPIA